MPVATGGGGSVSGANIVDASISDADIAANAAIQMTKLEKMLSIETTVGATHSLTTVAGQRVVVFAKGNTNTPGSSGVGNAILNYDGVQKDTVESPALTSNNNLPFCLMYTEIPGAGTKNVTVTSSGNIGSLSNVVITVLKY